ncbi:dTDP-4-dehydrorhamnose reductase [Chondrinema litorale]|uniref:dTDP-4-dehydrorhamnose reductase n=1 Tax=Chondrinema litorale TaxID=2994555 RepID=UPI002543071B|nr:dTDP-4-dehydrorhamnose reductase [Chondrinema litorale]UZS00196.1 dTDP-4-dehydrorhamnose reductase [Chondrinema litorale]
MKTILVTGSNGQLGNELRLLAENFSDCHFIFADVEDLDITNKDSINIFFEENNIHYCINCAAYTAVDKAESDKEKAFQINTLGPELLSKACKSSDAVFIHISTDFVFEGTNNIPYTENTNPKPVSVYGESKREGEVKALEYNPATVVIRTSWLYSVHGNNFVKTMIRLGKERDSLGIVFDQTGCPTYAGDLAAAILKIIENLDENKDNKSLFGLYHFSNKGVCSWFDFAYTIFKLNNINIQVKPITTEEYPLPAKRPAYSVMNTKKIQDTFGIEIPYWTDSLETCIKLLNQNA